MRARSAATAEPLAAEIDALRALATNPVRKLVVLGPEDGGVEHCSIDNFPLVRDLAADWIADTLGIA